MLFFISPVQLISMGQTPQTGHLITDTLFGQRYVDTPVYFCSGALLVPIKGHQNAILHTVIF